MDHCLQQISSEVPIVLPAMLRGKRSLLCCRAKGLPGSRTLRCEEKLSKDTARTQHKPGWAAGECSEVKGVRERETNCSERKRSSKNSLSAAQTRLNGAAGAGWRGLWGPR